MANGRLQGSHFHVWIAVEARSEPFEGAAVVAAEDVVACANDGTVFGIGFAIEEVTVATEFGWPLVGAVNDRETVVCLDVIVVEMVLENVCVRVSAVTQAETFLETLLK